MPWSSMMIMTSISAEFVKKKKKKKKKNFRPTYPNFFGHVTGNTHAFLFGLIQASVDDGIAELELYPISVIVYSRLSSQV